MWQDSFIQVILHFDILMYLPIILSTLQWLEKYSPFIHIAYVFTVAKYSTWNFSFPYKFADSKCFTETMYCKVFHLELSISQTLHVPSSLFWQILLAVDSHYWNFGRWRIFTYIGSYRIHGKFLENRRTPREPAFP